jgi:hypothetical protein
MKHIEGICGFAQHLQHAQALPGGVVFRQGDIGREFFIIFAGSVSVSLMDETTGKVNPSFFCRSS